MHTEIFIEGNQLDISADIEALFTYAVNDVKDFSARDTNFSKTIVLPGTSNNNILLGNAFEFTAYNPYNGSLPNVGTNFNAAKAAQCVILVYGIQVFKGIIRLMEVVMNDGALTFETAVFGELGGLVSAIGNRLLTGNANPADDLDFSAYNQAWTKANVDISWGYGVGTGGGSGVYFPLIDYGAVNTSHRDYRFDAFRPALYVKEYIEKILAKAGYSFDCPFFNTAFFKRLIIPHNEDRVYELVRTLIDFNSSGHSDFLSGTTPPPSNTHTDLLLNNNVKLANFTPGSSAFGGTSFTYNSGVPGTVAQASVSLSVHYGGGQGRVNVNFSIQKNGTGVGNFSFVLTGPSTAFVAPAQTFTQAVNIVVPNLQIVPGDILTVTGVASVIGGVTTGLNAFKVNVDPGARFVVEANQRTASPSAYGSLLQINNCIPKGISQKDFLLSIVKMFNLYLLEDPSQNKHLTILPQPDFFNNASPLDWSTVVDRGKEIRLRPMSEINARYFNFPYETDSDYDNELYKKRYAAGYADRTFDVGLDFVKDKAETKLIFASSPLVGFVGRDKYVTRICKIDGSGVETQTESKIRILQAKVISCGLWTMRNVTGASVGSFGYYGYAGHVDDPLYPTGADLNFGAPREIFWQPAVPYTAPNLFNAFYSGYMAEITDKDSKLLTCYVHLSPIDIAKLDFSKAIVIDGQIWRLNKIIDFDAIEEGVTKCEFLKVINLTY